MRTTRSRKVTAIVVAATCALSLGASELASAHDTSTKTSGTIDSGGPSGAEGRVKSRKAKCKRNRQVKLFRVQEGDDELFGSTRSDADGNWQIAASLVQGEYYILIARLVLASTGHSHICLRGRSPRVHL